MFNRADGLIEHGNQFLICPHFVHPATRGLGCLLLNGKQLCPQHCGRSHRELPCLWRACLKPVQQATVVAHSRARLLKLPSTLADFKQVAACLQTAKWSKFRTNCLARQGANTWQQTNASAGGGRARPQAFHFHGSGSLPTFAQRSRWRSLSSAHLVRHRHRLSPTPTVHANTSEP